MLRRALFGHHVQHHHASQNALLHGQPHHPLYGHLLSDHIDILPAVRFRREGKINNRIRVRFCFVFQESTFSSFFMNSSLFYCLTVGTVRGESVLFFIFCFSLCVFLLIGKLFFNPLSSS